MKVLIAVALVIASMCANAQDVEVQLTSRQQPTAGRVPEPSAKFDPFHIPHRTSFKVDHVVAHKFSEKTSDGRPCTVVAYVREQELQLDRAQQAEVAGACAAGYVSLSNRKEMMDRENAAKEERLAKLIYAGEAPDWLSIEEVGQRKSLLEARGFIDLGAGVGAIDKVSIRRHTTIGPYKAAAMYYANLISCQQALGNIQYSKPAQACAQETAEGFSKYLDLFKSKRVSDTVIDRCMRESGFGRAYDFDAWGNCISKVSGIN